MRSTFTCTHITNKEAAKILGISESTLRGRKAGTDRLTRINAKKSVRLIRQEVEAHLARKIRDAEKHDDECKMEQPPRPTFITVKQAAAMLGLSEDTVHHLKGGTQKLTRVRFGRAVRMIQQEVEDHINQRIKDSH
jgi:predicted DNA-binding transcriptional regulator AlpA